MSSLEPTLRIQVAYALPERQWLWSLRLPPGSAVADALEAAPLRRQFPDLDLQQVAVGVFGQLRERDAPLRDGDRVEVYRPLQCDPMTRRRQRAAGSGKAGR